MKKKILGLLLSVSLAASMGTAVYGETSHGSPDWGVAFTPDSKMESNFKTADIDEAIYGMQPGDTAVIKLSLENKNSTTTDWYMTNEVLYSLEDRSANAATGGGAYTYVLTYTNKDGEKRTLFSSDTVGGEKASEAGEGLHGATGALEDFFYLDTLAKGQGGAITLKVSLDGETQGNDYQDTLADLAMNFAVELNPEGTPRTPGTPGTPGNPGTPGRPGTERLDDPTTPKAMVQTGDDTYLAPYILAATISGCLFLALSVYGAASRRKKKEEGQQT